jgi:hypothetical protein
MTIRPCVVVPVYDDGAGAVALLERLAPLGLLLEHGDNRGKGSAVLTGLRPAWARGFSGRGTSPRSPRSRCSHGAVVERRAKDGLRRRR